MKSLVIAEKPSVARDIARVLGCGSKGNGYIEGGTYIVTWALGHLVTLAAPESYKADYKDWNLETLPMLPKYLKTEVIQRTGKQYGIVKQQMYRKDVNLIIIATDAGREGELVARWIIEKAEVKKPTKRLWISSVTDKAIKEGFQHLKDGMDYINLYKAAVARAEADWLVGLNATRALTVKYNAQLSCGRVQTPTLAIIAKREEQIRNFKPQDYYGMEAVSGKVKFTWQNLKNKEYKTYDKEYINNVWSKLQGCGGQIIDVSKKLKKVYAPALYDLTQLQREANQLYNFSAKETLNYMQSLYETHKALTYPRTDSRYLTSDIVPTIKERLMACGAGSFAPLCQKLIHQDIKPLQSGIAYKNFVDDNKVSDHHAIIPTEQGVQLSDLNYGERKIYELVVKRFLAVLYPPFEYEQTTITLEMKEEIFIAKGRIIKKQGWHEVSRAAEDEEYGPNEQSLPDYESGDSIEISSIIETSGKTKPPMPFTEATLLSAMENPAGYMDTQNKSLIKTIGETKGLGTVATRADIIEKLFNSFMIEKREKFIYLTSKGRQILNLAPTDLCSPELTARWEQKLSDISSGKMKKEQFESEIRNYTVEIVNNIKNSTHTYRHDNITSKKCPDCGKLLLQVNNKNGKMLVCQDRECGYRKNLAKITNARCPQCHKKLELVGEGEGKRFVCICGYREKLSIFNERKKEGGGKVTKKDVAAYMKKQKKEANEPINNAFADAFAKLKL